MTRKEIFILIIILIIAFVRFFFFLPQPLPYDDVVLAEVVVSGVVVDVPDVRENNTRFTIRPNDMESNVLAVVSNFSRGQNIQYGDMVSVRGVLETPENFITSSGNEFNYKRYLANKDIYFIIKNAELNLVSKGNTSNIKRGLFKIRDAFMRNINHVLVSPESDLANGLLLGARGGFDQETRDEFVSTGTIHIIALSGYNVTIVAEQVMRGLGHVFAQTVSIVIGGLFVVLFVVMAGASATAVRAGLMALIMLFARMTGRMYDAGRALVIVALLMVAYDARVVTDISFQLSFIATFGVLFITPKVISWVWFLPSRFGIREIGATTISATISVLPILLYTTGIFSIVSLPTNILILPLIPLTMFFAFCAGLLGFISPIISIPFAYVAHLLLSYILGIIHFSASLPFASFTIKSFPLIITLILYGLIIWWVFKKK